MDTRIFTIALNVKNKYYQRIVIRHHISFIHENIHMVTAGFAEEMIVYAQ